MKKSKPEPRSSLSSPKKSKTGRKSKYKMTMKKVRRQVLQLRLTDQIQKTEHQRRRRTSRRSLQMRRRRRMKMMR